VSGEVSTCRKCPARIIWTITAATGKRMPVDEEPVPTGDFVLEERGRDVVAHHVREKGLVVNPRADRFTSHFVTCPEAAEFRKGKVRA
jgi:hypothetical protein